MLCFRLIENHHFVFLTKNYLIQPHTLQYTTNGKDLNCIADLVRNPKIKRSIYTNLRPFIRQSLYEKWKRLGLLITVTSDKQHISSI